MKNSDNEEDIEIREIKDCSTKDVESFITTEINPYLTIPISNKLTEKSLTDYAEKLIFRSDGFVFVKNEKIVGIIAGYINNRYVLDEVYVTLIGVSKFMRGRGYGQTLIQEFIKRVPSGLTVWTNCDEENFDAQEFYRKMGFSIKNSENGRLVIRRMVE